MKELTIEQKAERYDEMSKEVKDFFDGKQKMYSDVKQTLNHLFPELKESEDDRIRKDIIRVLKGEISFVSEKENEKYIAWLEKQGEKPQGKSALEAAKEEKIDNQNCVNPTNNPEPKFREGDWLIENHPNNYARFAQILEIVNVQGKNKYRISRDLYNDEYVTECLFIEDNWHPFNIQDAKAGDVLVHNSFMFDDFIFIYNNTSILQAYCYYSSEKNRFIVEDRGHYCPWNMQEVTPATKEQRDLLFSKMKEAGYKWDADKKELKKIEQTPTNNSEPKFYEEDWITIDNPCQIISIDKSGNYIVLYCNDEFETHVLSKDFCESHYHLWTIQDAKAGDVLFGRYGIFIFMGKGCGYCGVLSDDTFINKTGNNEWTEELYPATKEQRDFLFKKMRKAGYEWDADKKEPKMIDWRKHTWTEKDEKIRKAIYNALKYLEWKLSWDFLDDVDILDVYDWLEKQK